MSLLTKKRTILAKIESVYGTDPTPTGSANAILVKNLTVTPIQSTLVSRDLIRPYLGNSEQLMAERYSKAEFEVEFAGPGAIGKTPAYDALLRACALAGAAQTTSVSIAVSSAVATVTKTSHGLSTGDKVVISGCTDTALNITAAITVTGANTFTYAAAGAADAGSAAGTPLMRTAYVYSPISSSFESATIYYNADGVLHKLTGCMGTVVMDLTVKQIPTFKFTLTGIYNPPSDDAAPSVDFSGFMIPQVANTAHTTAFAIAGYSANLQSMSLDVANDVQYITLIGSESVKILDRKPAGTFVLEAPSIGTKDFFTLAEQQVSSVVTITHGSANGYKVKLDAPSVLIGNPSYQDSNGVQMLSIPFTANPSLTGNDEFTITLK